MKNESLNTLGTKDIVTMAAVHNYTEIVAQSILMQEKQKMFSTYFCPVFRKNLED